MTTSATLSCDTSLQSAREAVEDFIHHLQRPLKAVDLLLARYRRLDPCPLAEEVHVQLEDALRRFTHYARLAGEATDLRGVAPRRVDIATLVRDTLDRTVPRGAAVFQLPADPDATADVDESHLALALSELVENSRKYGPEADLRVEVSLSFPKVGGQEWLRLEYRDNGPGIETAAKESVFERGVTLARPGTDPGTGRGLHYVAEVARRHGGRVWEMGKEGVGVHFVFECPRRVGV